jgi:predicted dehydrogenase
MNKIRIGMVGFGYWGKNILRNLLDMDNVEVIGICDANAANLEKATKLITKNSTYNPDLIPTTDYNRIIKCPEIDAVVIVTPPATHYELAMKALKAGKHVFIEKPMTKASQEAQKLVKLSKKNNKVLMVGHTFIYHPVINDLKKLIDSGELGEIYYLDLVMTNLGKYQKDNVTWDLGPHGLSIVEYLMGKIIDIRLNSISAIQENLPDVAYITAYTSKNKFANIQISWLNPNKRRELTIVGARKMAVFNDLNPLEPLKIYDKGIEQKKSISSWGESMLSYRHGNIIIPKVTIGEPLNIELTHFIDCIVTNKNPITDGEHGTRIVELIEIANKQLIYKDLK